MVFEQVFVDRQPPIIDEAYEYQPAFQAIVQQQQQLGWRLPIPPSLMFFDKRGKHVHYDSIMSNYPIERIRIGYLIHRIERLLQREIQARLSHLGITFSMFHFLRLLLREDGRRHKEITAESGLTPSTTASAMKSLEKEGLISRRRDTNDSREIYIYLTPKAHKLRTILDAVSNEVIGKAMGKLSPEQVQALQMSLCDVAKALEAGLSQ